MEAADDASWRQSRGTDVVLRAAGDASMNYDAAWNLTFGVNNHLVLLTATALFVVYLVASLMLFVWRWRGCLVRICVVKRLHNVRTLYGQTAILLSDTVAYFLVIYKMPYTTAYLIDLVHPLTFEF